MSKTILVTGGARSGKSSFAEETAKKISDKVVYVATSIPLDDEMVDRIDKHQKIRDKNWLTIENYNKIDKIIKNWDKDYLNFVVKYGSRIYRVCNPVCNDYKNPVFLIDCLSIMISNLMFDCYKDWNNINVENINKVEKKIIKYLNDILDTIKTLERRVIFVTNEVGLGIVPDNLLGRVFRDILGRANQLIAKNVKEVYLSVAGIQLKIK